MNPEIQQKIEETVLDILRNSNLEETTEFKVRAAASERLGIDLSVKEFKGLVRNLVESYLLSTAEDTHNNHQVRVKKEVNEDGDRYFCELSKKRSATVQDFKGKTFVSIREFYLKDGKRVATAKGISLPSDQWSTFKKSVPAIEEAIRKMDSGIRSKHDDKTSEDASNPVTNLPPCDPSAEIDKSSEDTSNPVPTVPPNEPFPTEIVRLDGKNYQRWVQYIEVTLKRLEIAYVLVEPCQSIVLNSESSTEEIARAKAAEQKWINDDRMCHHTILMSLSDHLLHLYSKKTKTAKVLWEELKLLHLYEEYGTKRSHVKKYIEFQMVEEKPVLQQVQELNSIADRVADAGMQIEEKFHVSVIISKLPPSWKDVCIKLMCEEHLPFWMLMHRLKVEEELRMPQKQGIPDPVDNNLAVPRMRDARLQACHICGRKGHSSRNCYFRKNNKDINAKRDKENGSTPSNTEVSMVDGAANS